MLNAMLNDERAAPPGSTLEPMVRRLEYRTNLGQADRAALLALPYTLRNVERRHFIVRERELATHCCVMLSGYSIRSKVVATGQRQIVGIQIRGEMVDLQNSLLWVADHSVEMLTSGRVAMIPRAEILRIASERPAVAEAMWRDTLVDGSISREWITNIGRRDARTRIAHLLCEFSLRLRVAGIGEQSSYELPITQEQIGDATGLTSVHVNRTIRLLERDGLIERVHPRSVHIGDWRKLADAGDFDSNYLHLNQEEPALN
jgi:CRP-like cAMP-binding protein